MFCLSPFCYVCLKNKEEFFSLNNVDADYMRLWDKLLYCMPEIEDIEDIPLFICRECRRDLRIAYTFRKKFVENFQYVDDYIRQLTYADKPVDGTEHADLCVTLVDCSKRLQHSTSDIKTETSECIVTESNPNSVDYYNEIQSEHIETDDEVNSCSDTENITLSFARNQEKQSTDISNQSKENSNQSFQKETHWDTFKNTIENPAKRRNFDNLIEVNDIEVDDNETITILENGVLNPQNNINSEEANVMFNEHDNHISSNTIVDRQVQTVQNVSKYVVNSNYFQETSETEEQSITNEKPAAYSTVVVPLKVQSIQTQEADQDIHMNNTEQENLNTNREQAENSDNSQISKQLDKHEYRSCNLQAACDNQTSSNNDTEENNTESSTAIIVKKAVQTKQSDTSTDLKQQQQAAKESKSDRPDDSVTNALFQSIRNTDRTPARNDNDDDSSSRPSVATSMYESDIIDGIDYNQSDNDMSLQADTDTCGYRQSCNVSSVYSTDYSDISSPENDGDMHMFSPNYEHECSNQASWSVFPEHADEPRYSLNDRESSSTTPVHIKSVTSDVEDNYSNETVLYQDTGSTVGNNISQPAVSKNINFSFLKAYLESSKDNNSIDIDKTSISNQETINTSNEKNLSVTLSDEPVNNNQTTSTPVAKDTEVNGGKCVIVAAEETKKHVYTSIRKKIPRLIDLNGSIRKNVSSSFELFTCNICNNKYSSKYLYTMHTQQAHTDCQTFNHLEDANIQQEILLECQEMLKDSTDITESTSKTISSNVTEDILQSNHETSSNTDNNLTYKCHICDMKFNYQSLLDCHLEKHTTKTVDPLPHIITNRNIVHDEHLSDNKEQYKCPVCDVQFNSRSLLACHLQTHNLRLSDLSRVNRSGVRNSLSRYKIPHLNQSQRSLTKEDTIRTRGVESVNNHHDDAQDKCECTMSCNDKMQETLVNKHKTKMVDEASDIANLHYLTNNKTKQLLQQHNLYTSDTRSLKNQTSKTIKHIDDKIHSKHTLIDKRCETDKSVNLQSKTNVTDTNHIKSQKKHHSSTSSSKNKDNNTISMNKIQEIHTYHNSYSNNGIKMIDKAIGTIDFSDNSSQLYSFTDPIEENMYRIHLGEINHLEQINKQCTNQLEMESSNCYGKKVINEIKSASVTKVDNSTETTNLSLPTNQCVKKTVVDDNVRQISSLITSSSEQLQTKVTAADSSEQPQTKVTAADVKNNNHTSKELDKCPLCERTFINFNSLREHLIIQHKAYKKFHCTLCEKNFRQRSTLHYHMLNNHSKAELFVCPVCHKNFSGRFPLKRHMLCHYGEKPFKCAICDKTFRYKESVKTHMVLHTGVKPYKCTYCDKAFAFKGNMVKHVQTHTKDKRYPCPLCDKDFSTNFIMKQHMRVHTGERPHKCPVCHRAFAVRQTMMQHISIHTDEKPFQCTICNARFKRKQHLRRHMYVHTEDKPYKCVVCDKDFRLKTELNKHTAIHCRTNKPYTCDICNIGYSSSSKLYQHNYNIHYKKDISLNSVILSENSQTRIN